MSKFKGFCSILLCAVIFAVSVFSFGISASTPKRGFVNGSGVRLRADANTVSGIVSSLTNAYVTINGTKEGERVNEHGTTWYNVTTADGKTGYIYCEFIEIFNDYEYSADFETQISKFPESYRPYLREMHTVYPNWIFIPDNLNLSFDEAVSAQFNNHKKWVEFTYGGNEWRDMAAYNPESNSWITLEDRWTYASKAGIEYFMDPRNSLNVGDIYVFMQQSYNETMQTSEGLRSVVKGTFLANGYDGNPNAYIDDIIEAARQSRVSPYVLAATIIVEQGVNGNTSLISGNYAGFNGYYNFFNFGASGNDIVGSGLTYAKNHGWNSRRASIVGGAKLYADGYISVGQDTYYYKDFNVVTRNYNHQYATALYDAWTNARRLQPGCQDNKSAALIFKIPVFNNMSATAKPKPSPIVDPDPTPTPTPSNSKGDVNGDGVIDVIDMARIRMYLLGVKSLNETEKTGADTNGDGTVDVVDLAAVRMHLLGIKLIK